MTFTVMLDRNACLLAHEESINEERAKQLLLDYLKDALSIEPEVQWVIFWKVWSWKMVRVDEEDHFFGTIIKEQIDG